MIHRSIRNTSTFLLAIAVFVAGPIGAMECLGPGGEVGPKPLEDITSILNPGIRLIQTAGPVSEFFVWEKRNLLLYRNTQKEIFDTPLVGGMPRPYFSSPHELSRIVDPEERYMSLQGRPYVYDVKTGTGHTFEVPPQTLKSRELTHLFWNGHKLYSAVNETEGARQKITLLKFDFDTAETTQVCQVRTYAGYQLASGSVFPHVKFYRVENASGGKKLIRLFNLDARKSGLLCTYTGIPAQNWYVAGPVESVYSFPDVGGLAVKMTHPKKNLLWADNTGCRHFHLGDAKLMVPNHNLPIFFTWDEKLGEGALKFLREEKTATLIKGGSFAGRVLDALSSSTWMTADAKRLFLAPKFTDGSDDLLTEITIP